MSDHAHVQNWLRPTQMICGVTIVGRTPVTSLSDLTCDRCSLRILRTGQALGWSVDSIKTWSLPEMIRLWTPERQKQHAEQLRKDASDG